MMKKGLRDFPKNNITVLYADDLMKYDEATSSYNLFLEKYPSHPLAVSAKEELDNMGLSPEEILKRTETVVK